MNMKQLFSNLLNLVGFGTGDSQKSSVVFLVVENCVIFRRKNSMHFNLQI